MHSTCKMKKEHSEGYYLVFSIIKDEWWVVVMDDSFENTTKGVFVAVSELFKQSLTQDTKCQQSCKD